MSTQTPRGDLPREVGAWYTRGRRRQSGNRADSTPTGPSGEGSATTGWPSSSRAVISRQMNALVQSPMRTRAFLYVHWRGFCAVLGAVVGLVAQMFLLALAWELWDLSVSLMEIWAELARKHLELTQ